MAADLTSAPVPPLSGADHVRGPRDAPLVILYAEFSCPHCAVAHARLREAPLRVAFRHFALRKKSERAVALACAVEAAALQGRFWAFHDALFADQGRLDDPHLWERAQRLGLDVERFDADRRSEAVAERVSGDVRGALRAGVTTTPTLVVAGALYPGPPDLHLLMHMAGAPVDSMGVFGSRNEMTSAADRRADRKAVT
jgi:protein-disulfide isomerase